MLDKVQELFRKLVNVPEEWLKDKDGKSPPQAEPEQPTFEEIPCSSYDELVAAWSDDGVLKWSDNIDVTVSTLLAMVTSTNQQGSQLWLRVIGPPGSSKTTVYEAIGANKKWCKNWSKFTGLHSGDTKVDEDKRNINELQGKTNLVQEGDMIISAPPIIQQTIMQDLRDIYSGILRADYKNGLKVDKTGVRSTWAIAGTRALRLLNKHQLGDRFLDVIIHKGGDSKVEREICKVAGAAAIDHCMSEAGEGIAAMDNSAKVKAIGMMVGMVSHLRTNGPKLLAEMKNDPERKPDKNFLDKCINLAQLVAFMRVRSDTKTEVEDMESELGTRLTQQFVRLVLCTAVVLNRSANDPEVFRRAAKVCEDTCFGPNFNICKVLLEKPLTRAMIQVKTGYGQEKVSHALSILKQIGCVRVGSTKDSGQPGRGTGEWRLSPQMQTLMKNLNTCLEG